MKKKKEKKKLSFMDVLIVFIFIGITAFVIAMMMIFRSTITEQTTLITSVFALATAELAFMWRIKMAKLKGAKDTEAIEQAVDKTYQDEEDFDAGCGDETY